MKVSRGSFFYIQRQRKAHQRRAENSEARACAIVRTEHDFPHKRGTGGDFKEAHQRRAQRNEALSKKYFLPI